MDGNEAQLAKMKDAIKKGELTKEIIERRLNAAITLTTRMGAEFLAGTKRNCSSIYISSCSLEEQNADQTWSFVKYLTPPPDRATNTSNFGANANYASECTSGHTYRIKATFAAVYDGTTYTVSRTSRGAKYQ